MAASAAGFVELGLIEEAFPHDDEELSLMEGPGDAAQEASMRPGQAQTRRAVLATAVAVGLIGGAALLMTRSSGGSTEQPSQPSAAQSTGISAEEAAETWHFSGLAEQKPSDKGQCHTTQPGEYCRGKVEWAMYHGIYQHPEWYPGLNPHSPLEAFQRHLWNIHYGGCPEPCDGQNDGGDEDDNGDDENDDNGDKDNCLCLFDIDRTLTAKQLTGGSCPGTQAFPNIRDDAYGGGQLVLSQLALNMESTFCGKCYQGTVSAGTGSGPDEHALLASKLPRAGTEWSTMWNIHSPLVAQCSDDRKADCAEQILNWYKNVKGVEIPRSEVYFFDDHTGNTNGFAEKGFNARQVSCGSREWVIGVCGGLTSEVVRAKGTFNCPGLAESPVPPLGMPTKEQDIDWAKEGAKYEKPATEETKETEETEDTKVTKESEETKAEEAPKKEEQKEPKEKASEEETAPTTVDKASQE